MEVDVDANDMTTPPKPQPFAHPETLHPWIRAKLLIPQLNISIVMPASGDSNSVMEQDTISITFAGKIVGSYYITYGTNESYRAPQVSP